MDFYFTDRKFNLLGIASTSGDNPFIFTDEEDKSAIDAAARTLQGTLYFKPDQSKKVQLMATLGNYVLYKDKLGKSVWMTIMEIEHDPLEGTHFIVGEDAGIDLINELVGPYKADKAYNIAFYINKFTFDSGFEIGINEIATLERKLEWESEEVTALSRIISVANQFNNAEIDFSFEIIGTQVVKRYINIYKKRGSDKRVTLYVNKDINKIITKGSIYDLGTSIKATGGTPEGKDKPIDLRGYKYIDQTGRFVLGSDGVMRDTISIQLWSRLLSDENPNPSSSHVQRLKTYETTSQKVLCDNVVRELTKISQPSINYEVDIAILPNDIQIGDTIYLADESETLYLSARVLELSQCYSKKQCIAILGDYLIQDDGISLQLKDLAERINNIPKGDTIFPWIRYADNSEGKGFSKVSTGKSYMAIKYVRNVQEASDNPADYDGFWMQIKGNDGKDGEKGPQGVPGVTGADGKTSYFHFAYANSANGKKDFSFTDSLNKLYIGQYTDFAAVNSTDPEKYKWTKVKGDQGAQGLMGIAFYSPTAPSGSNVTEGATWFQTISETDKTVIALYTRSGGSWEKTPMAEGTLAVESISSISADLGEVTAGRLTGVEIVGSEFINPFANVPSEGSKLDGLMTIGNARMSMNYNVSTGQTGSVNILPQAIAALINKSDGTLQSSYELSPSGLALTDKLNGYQGRLSAELLHTLTNVKNFTGTVPDTSNFKNAKIWYYRWGQVVNVAMQFELLSDTGWIGIFGPTDGYKPAVQASAIGSAQSTSYRGWTCTAYWNSAGWRLIPSPGENKGQFRIGLTYFTNDPWPK